MAEPIVQLQTWLDEARERVPEPHAMTLATATPDGRPSARVVLLRGIDERGLAFFTNRSSRKGIELDVNPRAALVLHWWELGRQVRVEGNVETLPDAESDAYWTTRPRGSRIAAWASRQSSPLVDRGELEGLVAATKARFGDDEIPRPEFWGGYRVVPDAIELWEHRPDRLHERARYERAGSGWRTLRLAP